MTSRRDVGDLEDRRRPPSRCRAASPGCASRHSIRSLGCSATGASSRSASSSAAATWLGWPCVQMTASTSRSPTASSRPATSVPGSMTMTSSSSPTIQTLTSPGPEPRPCCGRREAIDPSGHRGVSFLFILTRRPFDSQPADRTEPLPRPAAQGPGYQGLVSIGAHGLAAHPVTGQAAVVVAAARGHQPEIVREGEQPSPSASGSGRDGKPPPRPGPRRPARRSGRRTLRPPARHADGPARSTPPASRTRPIARTGSSAYRPTGKQAWSPSAIQSRVNASAGRGDGPGRRHRAGYVPGGRPRPGRRWRRPAPS